MMIPKIRYRLVFNYANRLNRDGRGLIALELRQLNRKFYLTSHVLVYPNQWYKGFVINHDNQEKLNVFLYKWKSQIEDIELNALLEGRKMTLQQMRDAIKHNARDSATIRQFVEGVILADENRKESTKKNYLSLVKEIETFYGDKITIEDITTDFIIKFRGDVKKAGLSENTVKGRLKLVRTIVSEALKRKIIKEDPFVGITIGHMTPRNVYLTYQEVETLENMTLDKPKEAHVRDAFVWCCCVGLRYSDFSQLTDESIVDGVLSITQQKTGEPLNVPLNHLFGGKPIEIMSRYKSIRDFAKIGDNANANRILKTIIKKAGIDKDVSWHCSRHTAGTLLNQAGLKMQEIQKILGHADMATTANIYAVTTQEQVDNALKMAFNKEKK